MSRLVGVRSSPHEAMVVSPSGNSSTTSTSSSTTQPHEVEGEEVVHTTSGGGAGLARAGQGKGDSKSAIEGATVDAKWGS